MNIGKNLFFTGFMATGKSRIGALTAASLGWKFLDTDALVVEKAGKDIPSIFREDGEARFRSLEVEVLRDIEGSRQIVAALGGGTLLNPEARDLIKRSGILVGLRASPEVILERANRKKDSRPLLAGLDDAQKLAKIRALLEEREPLYALADYQFESSEAMPHHVLTRKIIHTLQVGALSPLQVELGDRSYPIYVEEDLSRHLDAVVERTRLKGEALIVTDQNVRRFQKDALDQMRAALGGCRVFLFRPGEGEKNLKSLNKLFTFMLRHGYTRDTVLYAVSGGVVGDMTGFAAAVYMRGIPFVQVPTTLLSMVDSSVGGKTGVNHPLGKNMIGAFHQPAAVVANLRSLETLPQEDYLSGLAEVAKYAVIRDPAFFDLLEEKAEALLGRDLGLLGTVVRRCCAIKAEVVEKDEREGGLRAILNYGHTFGHALEAVSGYAYPHGLAVALGMRAAGRMAEGLGRFSKEERLRQEALLDRLRLPTHYPAPFDPARAYEAMAVDKKAEKGERVFILPSRIGSVEKVKGVPREAVLAALESLRQPRGMPGP